MIEVKRQVLSAARPMAHEQGWIALDLAQLADKAGISAAEIRLLFPRRGIDLALFSIAEEDRALEDCAGDLPEKIRDKIAHLIWCRLALAGEDKALARKTVALLALPPYLGDALRCLSHSCDQIWRLAGDRSVDFSYYTKRASLALVYTNALVFYLSSAGEDEDAVKQFIAREIDLLLRAAKLFSFSKAKSA